MTSTTRRSRSGVSSPESGYSLVSGVSDVQSISSSRRSQSRCSALPTQSAVSRTPPPVHPEFAHTDACVELWTPDSMFIVQEFQLNKFSELAERIRRARRKAPTSPRVNIVVSQNSEDIRNTLLVIYTSVASRRGTPPFDSEILVSTLKVASKYGNPELRQYAIDELESSRSLTAIRRIELSKTISIPQWEIAACAELCRRFESISLEEAQILGMRRFVDITRIREEEGNRNAVRLVDRVIGDNELINVDGTVARERFSETAEYTLRYPRLPKCDCRAVQSGGTRSNGSAAKSQGGTGRRQVDPSRQQPSGSRRSAKPLSVIPCQIHEIAPRIAAESRDLYSQRNDLVERLGRAKRSVVASQRAPGSSVEASLMETSWARRAA